MAAVAEEEGSGAVHGYRSQPATTRFTLPPAPEDPLEYPVRFFLNAREQEGMSALDDVREVTIFSSLSWLLPVFELAGFLSAKDVREHLAEAQRRAEDGATSAEAEAEAEAAILQAFPDVASALQLLPLFSKFFEEENVMIPQHRDDYHRVTAFSFPTPRGVRSITRSKVEGDSRATFAKPVHAFHQNPSASGGHAKPSLASCTVTNTTSVFSLLPGHDHFLVSYEKDKLCLAGNPSGGTTVNVDNRRSAFSLFTYLQLDQLRFSFAAVKELLEDSKTFNRNDGSLSLLAKRDIKKNNLSSPFCLFPKAGAAGEAEGAGERGAAAPPSDSGKPGKKASNVITGPRKELVEERRDIAQKRFLKADLEEECQRRWPHTPLAKSLIVVFEERPEGELSTEEIRTMGLDEKKIQVRKAQHKRGQLFYLGVVELPLLNKKGGAARFKASRLWSTKKDAESAAAEAALTALRRMK